MSTTFWTVIDCECDDPRFSNVRVGLDQDEMNTYVLGLNDAAGRMRYRLVEGSATDPVPPPPPPP